MDITFERIYIKFSEIFYDHTINLENWGWCDPWTIGLVCLKAIEYKDSQDKKLILPKDQDVVSYLKRMHLDKFLSELAYDSFLKPFIEKEMNEKENQNVLEILHCESRDDFDARLSSKIRMMFKNFGMDIDDESRATSLVGELGNNVFDHNAGSWPTNIGGAIILAQLNPRKKQIEVVVADPGIGFLGSLKVINPPPQNDIEAIKLGLNGVTGRIGEKRGDGLRIIQDWTINKFDGIVKIHSGSGLFIVNKDGQHPQSVFPILGTLASFVVKYK
ncbi:MAG: hypothetical protein WC705_00025 [Candidatus Paceibacterota bacterium]|jgi:hypothetical protein